MRHRMQARNLGRTSSHRKAMYRNLVTSLLDHERIETTDVKAKEVRRLADRMITLGKRGGLHARRRAMRVIRARDVAAKLFTELADRYRERPGGYTRVVKTRRRAGDSAAMSIVELVESLGGVAGKRAAKQKAPAAKPAPPATKAVKAAAKTASAKAAKPARKAAAPKKAKKTTAKKSSVKKKTVKKAGAKKTTGKKSARPKKPGSK
jgi:large subunit ribosomal protein L17